MSSTLVKALRAIVGRENVLDGTVDLQTYEYDAYGERSSGGGVHAIHCRDCGRGQAPGRRTPVRGSGDTTLLT